MELDSTQDPATYQISPVNSSLNQGTQATRSSVRVRAAASRQPDRYQQQQTQGISPSISAVRKGKARLSASSSVPAAARPKRSVAQSQPLTINEPASDPKGKKRALPSPDPSSSELSDLSDEELLAASSAANLKSRRPPVPKRLKTSRSTLATRGKNAKPMPNKTRAKKAAPSAAGPSNEPVPDGDIEMAENSDTNPNEETIQVKAEDNGPQVLSKAEMPEPSASATLGVNTSASTAADTIVPETSSSSSTPDPPPVPPADVNPSSSSDPPAEPAPPPVDPPLSSLMSGDFEYGAYMASLGSRLKNLLNNIKATADPTTRLMALQNLSEILSMSTEDNLNGYFSQDSFVRELVRIMGGKQEEEDSRNNNNDDGDESDSSNDEDENPPPNRETDTAEANALAPSTGAPPGEAGTNEINSNTEGTNAEANIAPSADIVVEPAVEDSNVPEPIANLNTGVPPEVTSSANATIPAPTHAPNPVTISGPIDISNPTNASETAIPTDPVDNSNPDGFIPDGMLIDPEDEDAALAAALAMSAGDAGVDMAAFGGAFGAGGSEPQENLEEQLLACRCLANLMEAMPGSAHTLVYHGAVPVLCSKLVDITFIDLAEQTISTLEKLSEEYPSAIVRENGLSALLNYLDFFSTHVQRTALRAAANCCRNMSSDSYPMIKDVFPTIKNVLSYSDQRLVELASMCVIRTIESFARSLPTELEQLITPDLVRSINALLIPQSASAGSSSGSQMITPATATLFLRALSGATKSSPNITITLLESGIANTLYAFLTGVLPPNHPQQEELEEGIVNGVEGEVGMGGQGIGSGVVDMAVMQNLAGRPKDQVEEALGLISELLPPLPKDGVFDPRGYTEKYVSRALKAKMKEARVEAKSSPHPTAPTASTSTGNAPTEPSIKVELPPQEAEIAAMLLIPENDTATPNNEAITTEGGSGTTATASAVKFIPVAPPIAIEQDAQRSQSVEMQDTTGKIPTEGAESANAPPMSSNDAASPPTDGQEAVPTFNSALMNADGEPLMAMMMEDADLPRPISRNTQDSTTSNSEMPPKIPAEVIAAIAGSSSSRHRHHAESSSTHARLQLLRGKPSVVSRFLYLIVPVLFDVYSASVTLQVRMRCFTGILKATSFVDGSGMESLYKNVPVASFIGSILTSKDNPHLVTNALQLVELLLVKSPSVFRNSLRKEGVLHEVSTISKMELKVKAKPPTTESGENGENNDDRRVSPRKSSSLPSDPQDAYVLRARLIKIKYLTSGSDVGGDPVFDSLKAMIKVLTDPSAEEEQLGATLKDIAKLFSGAGADISSFELLKSGLVDGLLDFATAPGRKVDIEKRKDLFLDAFFARSGYASPSSQSPMTVLVKRLQESLTRMETFNVVTTSPGSMDDAKRSSMNLISRTLRLKLQAEDPADVPKSCQNLMISIHAIAPFSALDEYLKPRIAGILSFRPELSPGILQALAGSGLPSSTVAQSVLSRLAMRAAPGGSGGLGMPTSTLGTLLGALASNPTPIGNFPISAATNSSASMPIPIPSRRHIAGSTLNERLSHEDAAAETSTSEGAGVARRRSLRLRGQPPDGSQQAPLSSTNEPMPSTSAPASTGTGTSTAQAQPALASSILQQFLMDDVDLDDDFDDEIGGDSGVPIIAERAFNVTFDGIDGGLTASTPQGTRIATPLPGSTPSGDPSPIATLPGPRNSKASKLSYADAAITAIDKVTDFHLEFRLNGELLPTDMTVYGACHQYEARRSPGGQPSSHAVWNGNYTITYRKVPGKRAPSEPSEICENMETDIVAGLAPDSPSSKILRLLRVLFRLNSEGLEQAESKSKIVVVPDAAFINNKLTAKLARQLEEIMILASNCLPDWALDLPQGFGFLFPFSTRYSFLQSTSFGYARLLNRVISSMPRDAPNNSRRDGLELYGRIQRRKVEVPRDAPMQVALKVFDLFGASSSILDVHFQGEVGTGLGPTLEFFASVCREFAWRELKLWRDADSTIAGRYVHHPLGLFPAPMLSEVVEGPGATERDRRRIRLYRLLGQFVARALLDSRIIDISFNKLFIKLILGDHVPLTVSTLKFIDPPLASSLSTLQQFAKQKRAIEKDDNLKKGEKNKRIVNLDVNGAKLEDMCLDFTVPGYEDLELKPNGKNIEVTAKNVEEYIELVIDAIIGRGARPAVQAFKDGFSTVFPVADLRTFSADELVMMFGNSEEDWSTETLNEAIKADHGFNVESKAIRDLIEIMTAYDKNGRRDFLQFITGSPKLPIGGFKALNPQLTVVRKPHEAPLTPDDYLPSVMTCAHYLKLPSYSSRTVMEKKLLIAMREGTGSFHLS